MKKEKVIELMKSKGYIHLNFINVKPSGYPDSQFLKAGKCIFIEFKRDKDTLSKLQEFRIDELNKNGFTAFAIHEQIGIIYPSYFQLNLDQL